MRANAVLLAFVACSPRASGDAGVQPDAGSTPDAGWLIDAFIAVPAGSGTNCRTDSCPHHSDTDLIMFAGSTWLVHRTAPTDAPTTNSSLRIYRSADAGALSLTAVLLAPIGRDIRAPH